MVSTVIEISLSSFRVIILFEEPPTLIILSDIIYNKSAADSCFKLINATLHSGGINVPHHNEYCIESLGLHDIGGHILAI